MYIHSKEYRNRLDATTMQVETVLHFINIHILTSIAYISPLGS